VHGPGRADHEGDTVTGRILGIVALVAVVAAGGTVWLVVRDEQGGNRTSNARMLRRLAGASALVVLVTVVFLRPWYWDVTVVGAAGAALVAVHGLLRMLERRASLADWGAIAAAMASVVLGSGLVTLGGAAAVVDVAALTGGPPVPVAHGGQVLVRPVLYQLFWGPAWAVRGAPTALTLAVAFQRALPSSRWAAAIVHGGFGVRSVRSGGCWVDPDPVGGPGAASSTASGRFPAELQHALGGRHRVRACPGTAGVAVPAVFPPDAVVAVWVDPAVPYALGGISAHGSVPWPGRPEGLAVAGLTGGYAEWGRPSCAREAACRAVPADAPPAYALSHEVVESITNPYGDGWFADAPLQWSARYLLDHGPGSMLGAGPVFPGEVADLCEPGQPDARRPLSRVLGPSPLAVAPFFRPGAGCAA